MSNDPTLIDEAPLPQTRQGKYLKLEKEELLHKIRQLRINGYNKSQIVHALGITGESYDNYTDAIYHQDAHILSKKREQALATDVELYKNRLEKALVDLNALYRDDTATIKEKIEAVKVIVDVSNKLMRVDSEGTALLELNPELREMIDTAGAFVRNKIEINQYNINTEKEKRGKMIPMAKSEDEDLFG